MSGLTKSHLRSVNAGRLAPVGGEIVILGTIKLTDLPYSMVPKPDTALKVKFLHQEPIDLGTFSESMLNLAKYYRRFVSTQTRSRIGADQGRLHISNISTGSTEVVLQDLLPMALGIMGDTNTIIEFGKHLKYVVEKFLGRGEHVSEKNKRFNKAGLKEIKKFINPVAKGQSIQLNVSIDKLNLFLDEAAVNQIQGGIDQYLTSMNDVNENELFETQLEQSTEKKLSIQPMVEGRFDRVILSLSEFSFGTSGYSAIGIIESISAKPVDIRFAQDDLAAYMLTKSDKPPFQASFIVDVLVSYSKGSIRTYQVLAVHERIGQ